MEHLKHKENIIYLTIWVLVLIFYLLHIMSEHSSEGMPLLSWHDIARMSSVLLPLIALFSLNNYLLIPRLLLQKRVWLYVVAAAVGIGLTILLMHSIHPVPHAGCHPHPHPHRSAIPMPVIHDLICAALVIGINLAVTLVSRQILMTLERERLLAVTSECRLNSLKAQINPHFYMNMLNNIHGLVDLNPERAKDMIIDMSRLMRYMLYDGSREMIPLSSETAFISDYVEVMRRRFSRSKVQITLTLPHDREMHTLMLPPLLLIVFVENAFKHGIDYRCESAVSIKMSLQAGRLHFGCINSIAHQNTTSNIVETSALEGGLGLRNVKKRLELLYGEKADLHIEETSGCYCVNLNIPLYEAQSPNH